MAQKDQEFESIESEDLASPLTDDDLDDVAGGGDATWTRQPTDPGLPASFDYINDGSEPALV